MCLFHFLPRELVWLCMTFIPAFDMTPKQLKEHVLVPCIPHDMTRYVKGKLRSHRKVYLFIMNRCQQEFKPNSEEIQETFDVINKTQLDFHFRYTEPYKGIWHLMASEYHGGGYYTILYVDDTTTRFLVEHT